MPIVSMADDEPTYANWDEVPVMVSNDPGRFRSLLQGGLTDIRRVLVLGDSQETSPGGSGKVYVPHLSHAFWEKVGYVGESPLIDFSRIGSGNPPAGWLRATTIGSGGPVPASIEPGRLPPGMNVVEALEPNEDGGQLIGAFMCLVHDAAGTADEWIQPRNYIDPSAPLVAEVYALTRENSGGVAWKSRPTDNPVAWSNHSVTGVVPMDPSDTSEPVISGRIRMPERNGLKYNRLEIHGSDPKRSTDLIGVRYIDPRRHIGVVVQSYSVGGYTSRSLIDNHGQCGEILNALDFDLVMLQYGANDAGVSPENHYLRIRETIDFVRDAFGDPCFPIVLVGDPWRRIPFGITDYQDQYPAVLERISREDPAIMAVNMRRILFERHGWGEDNYWHLRDMAHLKPYAQREVARALVKVLWGQAETPCTADLNGDGVVDVYDMNELLIAWDDAGRCGHTADFNDDGIVDDLDLQLYFQLAGPCPESPPAEGPSFIIRP